ncbi:MAG TPA: RNA polymerase sigma-70 factor [Solirubrobacterales bacterium]
MSDPHEELLEQLRPVAFAVAYRMLGSVAEAEDVVQEALLRLHQELTRREQIASPRAYLATVTTRLAIDELRSARVRRESYVGDWLPEPLVAAEPAEDPARQVERADSLSYAFLLLLESLTPEERAVLLLHDVFDYGYGEVAEVVGKSEDNARQLAVRARRHVEEGRPRFEGTASARRELGERFLDAAERGDMEALEGMLARDVVLRGDGGGKVPALARAVQGSERVARTLGAWFRVGLRSGGRAERTEINGLPGLLLFDSGGGLISALSVEASGGSVVAVNSVVNPDKLHHLGPVGDLRALLSGG